MYPQRIITVLASFCLIGLDLILFGAHLCFWLGGTWQQVRNKVVNKTEHLAAVQVHTVG